MRAGKRIGTMFLSLLLWTCFLSPLLAKEVPENEVEVLIYGGSFSGVAAARAILHERPETRILIVVPQSRLGEIGTVAAQNYWDARERPETYVRGTFKVLFDRFGRGYAPEEMAGFLASLLASHPTIHIRYDSDIAGIRATGGRIESVGIQAFSPDEPIATVTAKLWIDASFNGRLLRLAQFTGVTGRNDFTDETRQQAATLMFRITGLDVERAVASKRWKARRDKDGTRLVYGGWGMDSIEGIAAFNRKHVGKYKLKAMNIAGDAKRGYWLNTLLVYNVDGTKERRDRGTALYPQNPYAEVDEAFAETRAFVLGGEVERALRSLEGFEQAKVVDTAEMLYIRETIHSSLKANPTENDFALTAKMLIGAGASEGDGLDREAFPTRIGLGFYGMDSNGYLASDPWKARENAIHYAGPKHPVFVPFGTLLNPALANVLVCGYGANISSIAWFAMRVLPNQMVLGDAAGMAAAHSLRTKRLPAEFSLTDIQAIQEGLRRFGAVLEK